MRWIRLVWLVLSVVLLSASARVQADELETQIDTYLTALVSQGFSGAVLVAKDGTIILEKGYGLANDEEERPFTADTVFVIGSISKQFTAAAILLLAQQGQLQTDDPIGRYLADVPDDKQPITIHQLLSHSSGLPNHHTKSDFEPLNQQQSLARVFAQELLFEPGTAFAYSDSGYVVLAAIIEAVSGQAFPDYLHENLFKPAGMKQTGFFDEPRWSGLPVAHGYLNGRDQGSPATWPGPYWGLLGAGGIMSTVGDLYRWELALQNHAVLSPFSTEKLFTPHTPIDENNAYGYGWQISQTSYGGTLIWHSGAGTSHNAEFRVYVDEDLVLIIGSNRIDDGAKGIYYIYEEYVEIIYANEIGKYLSRGILNDDFSVKPDLTLPDGIFINRDMLFGLGTLVLVSVVILIVRLRRRGNFTG
jgi:CubicO group peptidase (beta-lactamase class C family)